MRPLYVPLKRLRQEWGVREGICYKKPYPTQQEAEEFAKLSLKNNGTKSHSYMCWCGVWHLTTQGETDNGH